MSDTARDYRTIEPAADDGLEDFFKEGLLQESSGVPEGVLVDQEGVSVEVAANYLGLSVSGVLKRLRKGALKGFKVASKRGVKWLVSAEALPQGVLVHAKESSFDLEGVLEVSEDSLEGCLQSSEESSSLDPKIELLEDLKRRNEDLEAKLQAASWRNGYLESKLEDREQQIKLLTDSQHKPSRWARFYSWFIGR
jgi:hypothetical protein